MTIGDLSRTTAIVTGASRGFGRSIATSLASAGAEVIGVSRSKTELRDLREEIGSAFTAEVADVSDLDLAARLIAEYRPRTVVLNAGAAPVPTPLHEQTWESFSQNWEVDVKQVFSFTRAALLAPLPPGSVVISFSSGAAVQGSPLSGGYAGAKATVRFVSSYAASESQRAALGIRFVSVLPRITPATGLGAPAVEAYAHLAGLSTGEYIDRMGGVLTVDQVAGSVRDLSTDASYSAQAYLLSAQGLKPLDP
jgi:NAD(P)-dependent dehydrogenase (short-subunit alcohol dehydrogenase family)